MNNADLVVALLRAAGIRHGFGVPSGNVLPLMEAMRLGGIDFVLTAHEGSAGFAADVTARVTGTPGLCVATLGPGATNLATGVGCAYLDRSPLIAITCTLAQAQIGRRIQMWIDHEALFRPITKASFVLKTGSIVETVQEALRIARTEPHGPVHLDLPEDVALARADETIASPYPHELERAPEETQRAAENAYPSRSGGLPHAYSEAPDIQRVVRVLASAKRPVAVIGASAMRMKKPDLLRTFVEHHGVPFASTTMAKGLIDEDHLLSLGCIERARRQVQRDFIRRHADLIVGLGYDTIEVEYEAWVGKIPVLHLDIERCDVDRSVNVMAELVGDLDHSLSALAAINSIRNAWGARDADYLESRIRRVPLLDAHREAFHGSLRPPSQRFAPHQAIDVVRRLLPRDGILAFDVGAHTHQIASQWAAHAPRTFLITNGWSSMGFGLPAAIAAKLAHPELPTVCLIGDGCFQMTCGELAVACREKLALPVVVLNDGWLSLIKVKQERRTLRHYGTALSEDTPPRPPAHYFGVPAVGVDCAEALEVELARALKARGPTVIEVAVDPAHYSDTVYD